MGPQFLFRMSLPIIAAAALIAMSAAHAADPRAEAAKGKSVVDAHCVKCHAGKWEGETTANIAALLRGMYVGEVAHRFRIYKLKEDEIRQVALYWTPDQNAPKRKTSVQIE